MQKTAENTQSELAQVEEISTAISELSSTSKEVSSNAVQAEDETRKASENVNEGTKAFDQSIVLFESINDSVQETANLIEDLKNSAINIDEVTQRFLTDSALSRFVTNSYNMRKFAHLAGCEPLAALPKK